MLAGENGVFSSGKSGALIIDFSSIRPDVTTELAEQAGRIARHYFNLPVEFERKSDDSPVTRADREIELFLRESLERRFPDHSILGEEFGETRRGHAPGKSRP